VIEGGNFFLTITIEVAC